MFSSEEAERRVQGLQRALGLPVDSTPELDSLIPILERMVEEMGLLAHTVSWLTDRVMKR